MRFNSAHHWSEIAKALPYGKSTRVVCCGKDASALVSHGRKGFSKYCFRCGEDGKEFIPHEGRQLAEILRMRDARFEAAQEVALPSDFTQELPSPAVVWLARGGVTPDLARAYGVGYSKSLHRVILPTYDEKGQLQYMQARALETWQKPKYLNKRGTGVRGVVSWSKPELMLPSASPVPGICVLTEDALSMFRVGRLQYSASLLGTTLTTERAVALMSAFQTFIVWLDGDKAGMAGQRYAMKFLRLHGASVSHVRTERDPKSYSNEEIMEVLNLK
jgi:hypothetical protein